MRSTWLRVAVVVASAAMLLGGAGTALAGGGNASRCARLWEKLAEKRGVTASELKAQWRAKVIARIDAAVKAGRLAEARAAEIRARVAASSGCPRAGARAGHIRRHTPTFRRGGLLFSSAISGYLGLSKDELAVELRKGSSLAAIAARQGKSVDGLKVLLIQPLKTRLDAAVTKGRLQPEWRDAALARYERFVDAFVQRGKPKTP